MIPSLIVRTQVSGYFYHLILLNRPDREDVLADLRNSWEKYGCRHDMDETEWIGQLGEYLDGIVKLRVIYVETWISTNLQRFKASNANVELLQRDMANSVVEL